MVEIRIGDEALALSFDEWEERVRAGRVPEDALVRFEPVTGDAFVPARELESYRSLRTGGKLAWRGRFSAGAPPILTALLVGFQIRIWWLARGETMRDWLVGTFTNWTGPALENAEVWRPLTMGLLHYQFDHIFMNMVFMTYTAYNLERAAGRANLAFLFFGSVLGGSLCSMFGEPATSSLGASGGVFGLMGASVVFSFAHPDLLPERHRRLFGLAIAPYLLFMLWSGLQRDDIDNFSHVGGLITGMLLMGLLDPPPVQRRPGWNNRVYGVLVATTVAVLATLGIAGPRLTPLADARALNTTRDVDPDAYRALVWSAPAAWRRGRTSAGDVGFASPAGRRAWAVSLRDHDRVADPAILAGEWAGKLERSFDDVRLAGPDPCTVAAADGLCVTAEVSSTDGPLRLELAVATRGVWALQHVWEVERDRADRLAPLRDRVRASIVWQDPEELVAARADAASRPRSVKARSRLAAALARAGEVDEASRIQATLIEEDPTDPDRWAALFESARIAPAAVADLDGWFDRALAGSPSTRVVVEVVEGMAQTGREETARGLLELAWARYPGDRSLKRARRRNGLPTVLAPSSLPWDVAVDPATLEPRDEPAIQTLLARPLTREAALRAEAARTAAWDALAARVPELLSAGDPALTPALLALRQGGVPADRDGAVEELREDLERATVDRPPRWLPASLHPHVEALAAAVAPPG